MSDQRLRELERQASHDGGAETRARLLRERVRNGQTTEQRLRLAAYLGDQETVSEEPRARYKELLNTLNKSFGQEAYARAALAIARDFGARYEAGIEDRAIKPALSRLFECLDNYILKMDDDERKAFADAMSDFRHLLSRQLNGAERPRYSRDGFMFRPTERMMEEVLYPTHNRPSPLNSYSLVGSVDGMDQSEQQLLDGNRYDYMRHVATAELLPWAFGDGDPVKERVEARERERAGQQAQRQQNESAEQARRSINKALDE